MMPSGKEGLNKAQLITKIKGIIDGFQKRNLADSSGED